MVITFKCSCGEVLEAPESFAGRKAYFQNCNKSVDVPAPSAAPPDGTTLNLPVANAEAPPAASAADPSALTARRAGPPPLSEAAPPDKPRVASGTYDQAPHYELVCEPDGTEVWKVTCFCGKRLLTPTRSEAAYGRCPKCERRIRLPGYDALLKTLDIALVPPPGSARASGSAEGHTISERTKTGAFSKAELEKALELVLAQDDIVTEVALLRPDVPKANPAEMTAAERLRPQRQNRTPETAAQRVGSGSGHIAAWPLAGVVRRLLAGFIDLTFVMTVTALVIMLAIKGAIPPFFRRWDTVMLVFICAGMFNDGVIQALVGGSLGKSLVVIVVRNFAGTGMESSRAFVRAFFKWVLIPGWIIAAVDPAERTLHDIICGTLVLKGRTRRSGASTREVESTS